MAMRLCVFVVLLLTTAQLLPAQEKPAEEEATAAVRTVMSEELRMSTMEQAHRAYARFGGEGFAEFRCRVVPDWDAMYGKMAVDNEALSHLLPLLKQTRFEVAVGPGGAASFSQQSDAAPPDLDTAERLRVTYQGMGQVVGGFLQTWGALAMGPFLPEPHEDFQMESAEDGYVITVGDEAVFIQMVLQRDFALTELEVVSDDFQSALRPTWTKENGAFRLASYSATTNIRQGGLPDLDVRVLHQQVDGYHIPQRMEGDVRIPEGQMEIRLDFRDCAVKRKEGP